MTDPFEKMIRDGMQAAPTIVSEEVLVQCSFGIMKMNTPDGIKYAIHFDVPLGGPLMRRVTIPFDSISFAKLSRQAKEALDA